MKKILFIVASLLSTSLVLTSCLKDDTTSTDYAKDAAITAFSINNIETTVKTRTQDNSADSTYKITLTGSKYSFVIDQHKCEIYNNDSLTYGTDVSRVVTNISYNFGVTYVKNNKDTLYSSTDSIDFRSPIKFTSYAQNGTSKTYTIKINVHQANPDSIHWNAIQSDFSGTAYSSHLKALYNGDKIFVYGQTDDQPIVSISSTDQISQWTGPKAITGIKERADYSSVLLHKGKIFILSGDEIYSSENGIDFNALPPSAIKFKRLLAQNEFSIWALTADNTIVYSKDAGEKWTNNRTLDPSEVFPTDFVSNVYYTKALNSNLMENLIIGTNPNTTDSIASIWTTERNNSFGQEEKMEWSAYSDNGFACPNLKNLSVIRYDNQLFAFGGESQYKNEKIEAFQCFFSSVDDGICWKEKTSDVIFPKSFLGNESDFTSFVDQDNYIWIIFNGSKAPSGTNIWKGQIHRLAANWQYK